MLNIVESVSSHSAGIWKKPAVKTAAIVLVSLAIGFFGGMEYKSYQIRRVIEDSLRSFSSGTGAGTGESDVTVQEVVDAVEGKNSKLTVVQRVIGEDMVLATVTLRINSTKETQTINGSFGTPVVAKQNAKFVVLDMDATNLLQEKYTYESAGTFLVDQQGRTFESYNNTIGNIKNYLEGRELSPSLTENGVVVFELPNDATGYSFIVLKGGTDDVYKVVLK